MKRLSLVPALLTACLLLIGCTQKERFAAPDIPADSAAELTLYAFDGKSESVFGLVNLGHAFVSLKNVSSGTLTVGAFTLPSGQEVSFGTWGMNAHWGIWYNLESTYMTLGRYDGRVSLTQGLRDSELTLVNEYLTVSDTWTPTKNCSYFASDVWNLVSDETERLELDGLITPSRVAERIRRTEGYKINRSVEVFASVGYCDDTDKGIVPFELRG